MSDTPAQSTQPVPPTNTQPSQNAAKGSLPRLVLTQIELENFKSYYGRRVIGPFHKRFSSIVGPNGSGKSNVIDALLFVFGRRAKQIRLKKISELVHTSENHPNCRQARVNVHFQEIIDDLEDENDYTVVPNSQVVISRIATKDNKSKYLLNDKQVAFAKVRELLLTKHVDLNNNRFLILQGEVESIAMMKPKAMTASDEGLLEYLEDIIGSNKYVEQIDQCSEQVETLTNEVQERLNRVKVVERDRDKLSDAKNEAQDYIKSQLQLWKLQGVTKQVMLYKFQNKSESLNENLVTVNNAIENHEAKQAQIQQEMKDIEDEYQKIRKEKMSIEKEVKKGENKFQELDQQDVSFKERLKYLKKEMSKIKKNRNNLQKQEEEMKHTIEHNEGVIPELEKETEELQAKSERETAKQEKMMTALASKTQPIKEAMEEKQKELMPLKDKENSIKQKMDIIQNNIDSIHGRVSDAETRKQEVMERIQSIGTMITNQEQSLENTKKDTEKTNRDLNKMNDESMRLQSEEHRLGPLVEKLRGEYDAAKRSFENSGGSRQRIVSALLAAQDKGDLTGICGRLGDLGQIDQRYDVAASTAATGPLNFIVVEKTHHAQRAIEFLKRHNLGRATMLILEKQRNLRHKATQRIHTPMDAPRLYDLITFKEERFNVAFYFAFRDTLVADNLDLANTMAFSDGKRWRVVTLQGQLIESTGAMTGGGNKKYSGLMSDRIVESGITAEQIQQIEERLKAAQTEMDGVGRRTRDLRQQMRQCQKILDKMKTAQRKMTMEINGLRERKQALQQQIPEIDAAGEINESDRNTLSELEAERRGHTAEFEAAQHDCELLEDEIRDLEEQILDAGGNKLREQKNLVDKLKKSLQEKSKLVTKLKVEIKSCSKKLKSSGDKFKGLEEGLSEMKKEYDEIKLKKIELEEKAGELMTLLDEQKEALAEKDEKYRKLSKTVEKSNNQMTKLTKQIFEEREKRKTIKSELNGMKQRIKKSKDDWNLLHAKFTRNKRQFLLDDDDEEEEPSQTGDGSTTTNKDGNGDDGAATTETEERKEDEEEEKSENAMDVDTDTDVVNENEEEKEVIMEQDDDGVSSPSHSQQQSKEVIAVSVYISENTLKFQMLHEDQLPDLNLPEIDSEIEEIKAAIQASSVNMGAIDAYRMKDDEYVRRLQDLQSCKEKRDAVRQQFEDCKKARFDSFMSGFSMITKKLKEMYRMLTCGGDAELELVDSIDPFSEGVQFSVRPPKKSWKNISNLSGGEKTLSSMALVFALHHYKPTPLYVMDEIDAALDFKNVSIVANYIHQRTKNAQFVIISLRNNMFELANRLVGIYKTNNASKSITIDPELFKLPGAMPSATNVSINNSHMMVNKGGGNGNSNAFKMGTQPIMIGSHDRNTNSNNNQMERPMVMKAPQTAASSVDSIDDVDVEETTVDADGGGNAENMEDID